MGNPKVVILGSGPGAIFSAFGAMSAGFLWEEVEIWGNKPTYPPGAFWLHEVPMNMFPAERVRMQLVGSAEVYSRLQWGEYYPSSAERYAPNPVDMVAYNPLEVLHNMWGILNTVSRDVKYTQEDIVQIADQYPFVVQTFPTDPEVIAESKKFQFPVYFAKIGDVLDHNRCVYNGLENIPWVRCTVAFGRVSVEYPLTWSTRLEEVLQREQESWKESKAKGQVALVPDLHPTQEPIPTRIVGKRSNIFLTGRWTTLDRKSLSHDSFYEVKRWLLSKQGYMYARR